MRIRWLGPFRALKQAPGRANAETNTYDCADYEIKHAGIKQNLKSIAHLHSLFLRLEPKLDQAPVQFGRLAKRVNCKTNVLLVLQSSSA